MTTGLQRGVPDRGPPVAERCHRRGATRPRHYPHPCAHPGECAELRERFDDDGLYRARVDMARYRFGQGTYRYVRL